MTSSTEVPGRIPENGRGWKVTMSDKRPPYFMEPVVYRGSRATRWAVAEALRAQGFCLSLVEHVVAALPTAEDAPEEDDRARMRRWLRRLGLEAELPCN